MRTFMGGRLDDEALIERLRARDRDAFARLVRALHGSLVRLAMMFVSSRATAEEIAQDTWGSVLASLDQFEGRSSLRTWIFRICTNRAKTLAGREARSTPLSAFGEENERPLDPSRFAANGRWADPPHAWTDETPERVLDRAQAIEEIQRALSEMPAMQRAVISLRDVQGLDSGEVCNVLEISESNQRVLLHRARSRVRRALERLHAGREE
jgi:RNA polymerase sigma-70 factor (ECF subfamily)